MGLHPLSQVLSTNKKTLGNTSADSPFVAVFTGATQGIGSFALLALCKTVTHLRVYLLARTPSSPNVTSLIAECQKLCPHGDFIVIKCPDLALIKEVDVACEEILSKERGEKGKGKVDFLCMSQGYLTFEKRKETKEGLDTRYSLIYYSRIRITQHLLPLLLSSTHPGGARIVSVFSPQGDKALFESDLSLRDPSHYSFQNTGSHVAYLKTFYFEELAKKYEGKLSLVHYFPGLVLTKTFTNGTLPGWFKFLWVVLRPLVGLLAVKKEESGQRIIYHLSENFPARGTHSSGKQVATSSDGIVGGGAYRMNWNNEIFPCGKEFPRLRREGFAGKAWEHSNTAVEEIEKNGVFTG